MRKQKYLISIGVLKKTKNDKNIIAKDKNKADSKKNQRKPFL